MGNKNHCFVQSRPGPTPRVTLVTNKTREPEFHLMPDEPESPREILKRYALALMENAQHGASNGDEYEISEDLLEMTGVMEENGAAVSKLILEHLQPSE